MNHFPIFMAVAGRRITLAGGGEAALAKLRLLLKTQARITVIAADPDPQILRWAAGARLTLIQRPMQPGDALCSVLFYAAHEDATEDARTAALAHADGALVNIVDNLHDSQFITPAIVDRDPVTVAIGTEGAAPVLARAIKRDLEERLPAALGPLARIGKGFRKMAEALPFGAARRDFWADYYFNAGPKAAPQGEDAVEDALDALLHDHLNASARPGHVDLVGAGPGDPDLLTLKARKVLDRAEVVIHDATIPPAILDLARREAVMIDAGATPDIISQMIDHGRDGAHVVRLISGDGHAPAEVAALTAADLSHSGIPGIPAPAASQPAIRQPYTSHTQTIPTKRPQNAPRLHA